MKGVILGYNPTDGGFIRAEDGNRYVLRSDAWRGDRAPRVGEDVDFEVNGEVALDVYPLGETVQESVGKTFRELADSASRIAAEASNRMADPSSNATVQKISNYGKKISASMFALIFMCFFLPFITVSCDNTPVVQMSGIEVAVGKTVSNEIPRNFQAFGGQQQSQKIPGDGKAVLAIVAAAVGLGTSLIQNRKISLVSGGAAVFGLLLLLSLKSGIDKQLIERSTAFRIDFGMGFWGSVLLFFSAACLNIWLFFQKRSSRETTL